METLNTLTTEYGTGIIWAYVLVWGVLYGFNNTLMRMKALIHSIDTSQLFLAQAADMVWYVCIGYLIFT